MTKLWQTQKDADEIAEKAFEAKKYADPEWQKIQTEIKSKEWKEESDPIFQMKKQQYEMSKAYAEKMYRSDPKWQQAHYQYELADCEADYSKYLDPKWQKAH